MAENRNATRLPRTPAPTADRNAWSGPYPAGDRMPLEDPPSGPIHMQNLLGPSLEGSAPQGGCPGFRGARCPMSRSAPLQDREAAA